MDTTHYNKAGLEGWRLNAAADGGGVPKSGQSQPRLHRGWKDIRQDPNASRSRIAEGTSPAAIMQALPILRVSNHHLVIHSTEIY